MKKSIVTGILFIAPFLMHAQSARVIRASNGQETRSVTNNNPVPVIPKNNSDNSKSREIKKADDRKFPSVKRVESQKASPASGARRKQK